MLLPTFRTRAAYDQHQPDPALWLPAMQAICQRHNLPSSLLSRLSEGTNVVFAVGDAFIIKLYPPFWQRAFRADRDVAQYLHGKLAVRTPTILTSGELEGYAYTVMERLPGHYLAEIWDGLRAAEQTTFAVDLGELLAQLHALPTEPLTHLHVDWPTFVARRRSDCVARHRGQGLDEHWLAQIPGYLASAMPLYPPAFRPALVSADMHPQHLVVDRADDAWRLCGWFDFDDAVVGFAEYDLAASALFLFWGRPVALRTFLLAYGYREADLDAALRRRLLAYTLLHPYRALRWVLHVILGDPRCTTLEELADLIYSC